MVALSLRTWRRNGIACDELLFLPGTVHGEVHGVEGPRVVLADEENQQEDFPKNEGDVAAGGVLAPSSDGATVATLQAPTTQVHNVVQASPPPSRRPPGRSGSLTVQRQSIDEDESSVSSIQEFVNTWDDDMDESARPVGRVGDIEERAPLNAQQSAPPSTSRVASDMNRFVNSWRAVDFLDVRADASPTAPDNSAVGRFRQNHPRITRFGSFFFFRSSQSSTHNAEYAPSGPAVFGAALDLSMPVLFNFHLFIEAFNHMGDSIATKTLPLIFLTVLIVRTCFPPKRRMRFWNTVSFIFKAPYQRSRFRDSYLGDVLTSLVRPCQDILFALSYYVTVIWGTVTGQHGLHRSGEILQQSWLLMNVILPACAILPLWFKFLQTLRECYDTGKRWPHLGNAFKYMSASLVVLYGMTHPEDRRSPLWLVCFGVAVLYQVFWDTVIDWELFVIAPRTTSDEGIDFEGCCLVAISSVRPTSRILLALQRNVLQPIRDVAARSIRRLPSWRQIQLRPRRLYKSQLFYWRIFFLNAILRFAWMLCFIPAYHLSASGNEQVTTFSSDTITYVGVLLPVAEIFRRTLWGFLYLEMKTIKMMGDDMTYSKLAASALDDEHFHDLTEASIESTDSSKPLSRASYVPVWLRNQQQQVQQGQLDGAVPVAASPTSSICALCLKLFMCTDEVRRKIFIGELSLWAFAFIVLGVWATN
jgi:EXS family